MRRWWLAVIGVGLGVVAGVLLWPTRAPSPIHSESLGVVLGPRTTVQAPNGVRNVIVVIGCTVRKDQTTVYAPELNTTPFLAELAAKGAVFDDLIAAAPWTKASSTAILTGQHALAVGMVEEGPRRNERVVPDDVMLLAQRFSQAGYRTVGATTNPNLHSSFGFARGFESYGQPEKIWGREGGEKTSGIDAVDFVVDSIPTDGEPFYAQLMLVDAHAPFRKPGPFAAPGVPETVAAYRATLARLDDAVRHLFQRLDQEGLLDNTVLLFVNDHGEGLSFPEHHGKSHGRFLFPSSVGGVGIIVGPGVPAARRIEGIASHIDLAPTLWSLAGLQQSSDWMGQDLSGAVTGASQRTGQSRAYVDTWFRSASRAGVYTDTQFCQFAAPGSEVVDLNGVRFTAGCFDRSEDPLFEHPRLDPGPLRELYLWREAELQRGHLRKSSSSAASEDLDAQLEALGYAD